MKSHATSAGAGPGTIRRNTTASLLILLLLFAGCSAVKKPAPLPMRPTLSSATENSAGGICLDARDTATLLRYVRDLERTAGRGP